MFTVIIAEKDILEGFEKYRLFLSPLLQDCDTAFCEWNNEAESLEAMVPSLYNTIAKKNEWRAVVIQSADRHQKNPFDFTGYGERADIARKPDWDKMAERRVNRFACYERAMQNPLTKITSSLCGAPVQNVVIDDRELYKAIVSGDIHMSVVMLSKQLEHTNISELVRHLSGAGKTKVIQFIDEEKVPELLQRITDCDAEAIVQLIGQDKIIRFIKMIGKDDPRYSDPEYAEFVLENTKKAELMSTLSPAFDYKNVEPSEIICVALRTYDSEEYDNHIRWQTVNEHEYSRFSEFNLYVDKLKFIAFDVEDDDHKHFEYDMIRFLSFVLILAQNETPFGAMLKNRLYSADCENDRKSLSLLLSAYDTKLQKTIVMLKGMQEDALASDAKAGSSSTFMAMLESPVSIPLVLDKGVDVNELRVKYKELGLANECPSDEGAYFERQYFSLRKKFQQYVKQPRRALIRATEDLRMSNTVNDSEALYLSAFQLDDVVESINDAEQSMVSTVTANIYNTARYNETMEEAKRNVNKGIATRMTKRVTVWAGIIALAVYLIGFIPLFITSANSVGSFAFSGLFTAAACGAFAICGLCCLFVLRRRLVARFKQFNAVMSGIVGEITAIMHQFSRYLTYACTFMRGFSAVNRMQEYEKTGVVEYKMYKKHIQDMQRAREEFKVLFSNIVLSKEVDFSHIETYEYDFTQTLDYVFDIPFDAVPSGEVEFMREGNSVDVPIGYVKAITLKREELYDV